MIIEDFCSYEVAKLLKKKGFNNDYPMEDCIQYPCTLQMAMKWLREEHNLFIDVYYDCDFGEGYRFSVHKLPKGTTLKSHNEIYSTYEQAIEAALKYSLENLI